MTIKLTAKMLIATTTISMAFSGAALAGPGKEGCDKTKTSAAYKSEMTQTSVASDSATMTAVKTKKVKKTYSFEQALEKCQAKGVSDLQACIDKKTGQKPQS